MFTVPPEELFIVNDKLTTGLLVGVFEYDTFEDNVLSSVSVKFVGPTVVEPSN